MFTLVELSLKFPNNLRMLSNIQNNKIPKFQQIWIKATIMFVTTKYCEDWIINSVFKVLKHYFSEKCSQTLALMYPSGSVVTCCGST